MTQRIYKFRAWDKKEKKWLLGYEMPNLGGFSMFGEVMMMGEYASLLSSYFPDRLEDIVLMQFTGLLDKNDREVFEGDVLASGTKAVTPWEVVYKSRWGKYVMFAKRIPEGRVVMRSVQSAPKLEIIGNVHEHPTLISHPLT